MTQPISRHPENPRKRRATVVSPLWTERRQPVKVGIVAYSYLRCGFRIPSHWSLAARSIFFAAAEVAEVGFALTPALHSLPEGLDRRSLTWGKGVYGHGL